MSENCEVCDNELSFQWSDTHGVGACFTCGTPYTIFHYDDNKKRIDKPPEVALDKTGVDMAKRYWSECHRRVFPGCFDVGFLGGRSTTYSGATQEDITAFNDWYNVQLEVVAESA